MGLRSYTLASANDMLSWSMLVRPVATAFVDDGSTPMVTDESNCIAKHGEMCNTLNS